MSIREEMYAEMDEIEDKQKEHNRNCRVERMMREIGTDDDIIRKLLEVIDKEYSRF